MTRHIPLRHELERRVAHIFASRLHMTPYIPVKHGMMTYLYGVPTISRPLQIVGLFWKRAQQKRLFSAKETYNLKEPTNCSHPIRRELERREGHVSPHLFTCHHKYDTPFTDKTWHDIYIPIRHEEHVSPHLFIHHHTYDTLLTDKTWHDTNIPIRHELERQEGHIRPHVFRWNTIHL